MRRALLALLAVSAVLAGCLDQGTAEEPGPSAAPTPTPSARPPMEDCDVEARLPPPPTWAAHDGSWGTFVQPALDRPQGIRGVGTVDPGLSLLIDHATPAASMLDASVDLALVSGHHPDGAGLAFYWAGDSYNIVRFSPSEGGWHLFTVIDGERTKANATAPASAPVGPDWCGWTTLRVVADGAEVQAFQDGQVVLEATLPTGASTSGEAGLFIRGDTVALFAGYTRTA